MSDALRPTLSLPRLSRVWLIALRDFVGYVKTWGFWLSFLFPVFGGLVGLAFARADFDISPPRYETLIDETGYHGEALLAFHQRRETATRKAVVKALSGLITDESERAAFERVLDAKGPEVGLAELRRLGVAGAEQVSFPEPSLIFVDSPADTLDGLRPWLEGSRSLELEGGPAKLNGAIIFRGTQDDLVPQYWTRNFTNAPAERLLNSYLRERAEDRYLASGGLSAAGLDEALSERQRAGVFDPTKTTVSDEDDEGVSMWDRLPFFAGAGLGFFLLMTIFAGSVALLTSMIEEKMNKLLEMMLASAKFSEIMLGKMLGAAMLTLASLAPYILLGIGAVVGFLLFGSPEQVAAIKAAFPPSTIVISLLYLVLGYMFYATILISLGALAQSMQDAQTLSLPMVLVMLAGVVIIQIGLAAPDSGVVTFASIFPLTSPFAMMIRLATDPPLWQVVLSLALLAGSVVGVMALCARIFRFGLLSGGGVGAIKAWFARTVLRRGT